MNLNKVLGQYGLEREVTSEYMRQLGYAVRKFAAFLGREPTVDDLDRDTVNGWLAAEHASGSISARSRRNIRASLLCIWRYVADEHDVDLPQRIRKVKVPDKMPEAWTFAELEAVADAAKSLPGTLPNGLPRSRYFATLIWYIYETGLRRSDAMNFSVDDLKNGRGVKVQSKTGDCHVYAVTAETIEQLQWLAEFLLASDDPNWKTPLKYPGSLTQVYYWFRRIRLIAGVDFDERNRSCQHLRRTGATQVEADSPHSAWKYLGHRSGPALSRKSYVDRRITGQTILPARNRSCPNKKQSQESESDAQGS